MNDVVHLISYPVSDFNIATAVRRNHISDSVNIVNRRDVMLSESSRKLRALSANSGHVTSFLLNGTRVQCVCTSCGCVDMLITVFLPDLMISGSLLKVLMVWGSVSCPGTLG